MERESGMVKWNKFNDAENSRDINEIEQYVNSELVVHSEMFAKHIQGIYNQSFFPYEITKIAEGYDNFHDHVDHDCEDYSIAIPTTFLFGSFTKPENIMLMNILTPNMEDYEEEETLYAMSTRIKKYVFMLRNIIKDVDFVITSFPIHLDDNDIEEDEQLAYKAGLYSVIYTPLGSPGRATSYRNADNYASVLGDKGTDAGINIRYEIPSNKTLTTYKSIKREARRRKEAEVLVFANMLEDFYKLPLFPDEFALNTFIDQLEREDIKVVASRSIFQEELQDKVVSLPTNGFLLSDDKMNREEWREILGVIMSKANIESDEAMDLIDLVTRMEEEE